MTRGAAVRLLGPDDAALLLSAADVFDNPADPAHTEAFLRDPRHHIAAAFHSGRIVGFASAVDYLHPDKPRALWINEVSVAETFQRQGRGLRLMQATLAHAWELGCAEAWVLTEDTNAAAKALYALAGGLRSGSDLVMYTFHPDPGLGPAGHPSS